VMRHPVSGCKVCHEPISRFCKPPLLPSLTAANCPRYPPRLTSSSETALSLPLALRSSQCLSTHLPTVHCHDDTVFCLSAVRAARLLYMKTLPPSLPPSHRAPRIIGPEGKFQLPTPAIELGRYRQHVPAWGRYPLLQDPPIFCAISMALDGRKHT